MFIPLHDGTPLRRIGRPWLCWALIGVNVALWLAGLAVAPGVVERIDVSFGLIPAVVSGDAQLSPELALVPPAATFVTFGFLHAGFVHLIGNMAFLFVFGDNIEDAMGHLRFLAFYLLCGAAGGAAYVWSTPGSESPLIGASAAVSGVIAAYLLLHPGARIFGLAFNIIPVRLAAAWAIGAWIAVQIGSALFGGDGNVGWWSHVGGVAAGLVLTPLLRRRAPPDASRGTQV